MSVYVFEEICRTEKWHRGLKIASMEQMVSGDGKEVVYCLSLFQQRKDKYFSIRRLIN